MRAAARSVLLLALLWPGVVAAQWQLEQAQVSSGTHAATSVSFHLQGCLSHDPGGVAGSASYTAYSGCGAQAILLPGEGEPPPTPTPTPTPSGPPGAAEIPALSQLGWLLLAALLAATGALWLRRLP